MLRFKTTGGWVFVLASLVSITARSYTITETQSGHSIRWHHGQKFYLAGNSNNERSISPSSLWNAVVNGLQQWKQATEGMFDFEYWQGTNPTIYKTQLQHDGTNSIFFASNSSNNTDPNVIGFTQVWFNTGTGDLIEADIILNDRDYDLTENPNDTSSRSTRDGSKAKVYLNNVITHELGHAVGLSHSHSINSTMLYVEFSEQSQLGCDDWFAAKHLYPYRGIRNHGGTTTEMGSLTGVILNSASEPVSGAVVTAISNARGVPITSVHTDEKGLFTFGALETGSVSLMVESFEGSKNSVPARVQARSTRSVCGSESFPTNFITENDSHTLKKFEITANTITPIGAYRITCNEIESADTALTSASTSDVFVDRGVVGESKSYTFHVNGDYQITGLGYLLLSPINVSLEVVDASGNPVKSRGSMYRSKVSDFEIHDSTLSGTAFGTITVKVTPIQNDLKSYPTPALSPHNTPYYVLNLNRDPHAQSTSSIPNNARCISNAAFPDYQSPPGNPIREGATTTVRESIGFCGNANASTMNGKSVTHPTASFGSILGWFLPFLTAIVCQLFLRSRRAKLKA